MDYFTFVIKATQDYGKDKVGYRLGQTVYNRLAQIRPDIAQKLVDTPLDPYYNTSVKTETWEFIHQNW